MANIGSGRSFAPVAAPPPPKPPQLNICAAALMPDVATDTLGPGGAPRLASMGLRRGNPDPRTGRETWNRPPGVDLSGWTEERNAIIASIDSMKDVEIQQVTGTHGVTWDTLPESLFPASADTRWTEGFAYAPENQYAGVLADPCGQTIDLPAVAPPVISGVNATGSLASGNYRYKVTAVNANGESLPSNEITVAVTTGGATITITQAGAGNVASWNVYRSAVGGGANSEHLLSTGTGTTTNPFTDGGTGTLNGSIAPPAADTTGGPGNYTNLATVEFVPFLIQVEDECSTWGFSVRDYVGRALRLLDNATPNAIERELWAGAFAQNTFTGPMAGTNAFFMQSSTSSNGGTGVEAQDLTPVGGPPSLTRGVQILEDYLANSGFGGQGMIHVAPETAPNLLGSRRVGGLLLSVMDNIIVPGSGYPTTTTPGGPTNAPSGPGGSTPAAGTSWIYATDLVSVRLDKPVITPDSLAEAMDRSGFGQPNTVRFRAQRFAAATWDGARLAAVRVTLPT